MLFDRDVDGVLSLAECGTALHTLGYRLTGKISWVTFKIENYFHSEKELLERVSNVTEDELNLSVEFNEFLIMMSSADRDDLKVEKLVEAFKYINQHTYCIIL